MKHLKSRKKIEQKQTFQHLIITALGIISLILFIYFIGFPLLIKISVSIANFRKENITPLNETAIISEPFLDNLPIATNSAVISVSGNANEGETVILYLNSTKVEEKVVGKDGLFTFKTVNLNKGENQIYAIAKKEDKKSLPSKKITILYDNEPPSLAVITPQEGEIFHKENQEIEISGNTEAGVNLFLNDRVVIVNPDGSLKTTYQLNEGANKLIIKAVDLAQNSTQIEREVIYQP